METGTEVGKTLLVVEDSDMQREALALTLKAQGYNVISATDGRNAMDQLRAGLNPDLIILDMLMPVLDGWHFLTELRRARGVKPVPVIVTTATVLSRQWASDHGCAGFVHKPFDLDQLTEEVRRCLAPPPAPPRNHPKEPPILNRRTPETNPAARTRPSPPNG